jgi:tetratricopeptide (TPR) repeat protein
MTTQLTLDTDYSALFRQNVIRSVRAVLGQVQQETTAPLSETARTRIFTVLDYAFAITEIWPTVRTLLLQLAPQFNQAGYWTQWLHYLEEGLAASISRQDEASEAALAAEIGLLHQRQGRFDVAQSYLQRARVLAHRQADNALQVVALQRLAENARLRRHYTECANLLHMAQSRLPADHPEQAPGYFVAGKAAFDQQDYTAATQSFTQAMQLWEKTGNSGRLAWCVQNLARIAWVHKEFAQAIELYEQALALLKSVADLNNLAVVNMNLGIIYYECHQYEQALTLYHEAETHFQTVNDTLHLAMVHNNIGLVYMRLQGWPQAELHLWHSIGLYQQVGDPQAWIDVKDALGLVYIGQNKYPLAIQMLEEALQELEAADHDHGFDRLWQKLTTHLQEARTRSEAT